MLNVIPVGYRLYRSSKRGGQWWVFSVGGVNKVKGCGCGEGPVRCDFYLALLG